MTTPRKVLLVNGSPRGRESVSQTLVDFLNKKLTALSVETEMLHVISPVHPKEKVERFHQMMDSADSVVLVFPLYVDHIPSGLMKFLEDFSLYRKSHPSVKTQSLMAVVNSGFPEASQNDNAVAVCRRFAESEEFDWLGGLTLGGGGVVPAGSDLEKAGGRVFKITKALEAAALCLADAQNEPLPESVLMEIRKPLFPHWFYRFMADWGFKSNARKNGVSRQMKARPYSV
jgi:multimeric flavodoxin WrbA